MYEQEGSQPLKEILNFKHAHLLFFFSSLLKGNSMWNLHRIYATNHYTIKHSQFQAFLFWFEIAPNQQSKEPGVSNFSYYVTAC